MKKTKRYDEGGGVDVENMKTKANEGRGIFAGAAAPDESDTYAPKTRTFSKTGPAKPNPRPRPAAKAESSSPVDDMDFQQNAAMVMRKGQAGPSDSGKNASLDKLMADRKVAAFNAERKANAEERKKTARSTEASSPVTGAGFKKGGMTKQKSASARADGCALRGKTRA